MKALEKAARALGSVQFFSRFNDWTSDKVDGLPIEICRYGADGEDEIVVVRRLPASKGSDEALYETIREFQARAVIASIEVDDAMVEAFRADDNERRYIQGFLYGNRHVIRDVRKPAPEQELWCLETDDYDFGHQAMMDEIARIHARASLKAFLHSIMVDGEGR